MYLRTFVLPILCVLFLSFASTVLLRRYSYSEQEGLTLSIPLNIFQTCKTKKLGPVAQECVDTMRERNPEFNYFLYDDNDCRKFLSENYEPKVLDAYDTLVPGAYKADLWRYCVLYKHGGVYLDVKFIPVGDFKLITLMDNEHFCKDLPNSMLYKQGVYNAFMICRPGNKVLKHCINQVVQNVSKRFYGTSTLGVTGPTMMADFFEPEEIDAMGDEMYHDNVNGRFYIMYKDDKILMIHPGYRSEQTREFRNDDTKHYSELWQKREIYND